MVSLLFLLSFSGPVPTLADAPRDLILYIGSAPSLACNEGAEYFQLRYRPRPSERVFQAVVEAQGGVTDSQLIFGLWERETYAFIPAGSPMQAYTLTLTFSAPLQQAPLYLLADSSLESCKGTAMRVGSISIYADRGTRVSDQ